MSEAVRNEKARVVEEIQEKIGKAKATVVIDYMGITVGQADAMRKKLREANVDYTVYKNTLVKRAIVGTSHEALAPILDGPSAFAISYDDPAAPAKILHGIIKDYKKMAFKAGVVEGVFYDAAGIEAVATIPSRDELIAKFMGSIQSPVSKAVRTFQALADAKAAE